MDNKLEIGKLDRRKIKDLVFEALKTHGFTVYDVSVGNGYYLFDLGEGSVVHFKIKGIRKWLFALWITDNQDKTGYNLEFFGNKINWIDKFKPSRSTLSCDEAMPLPLEYTEENQYEFDLPGNVIFDLLPALYRLKANRHIAEYGLDTYSSSSFIKWAWDEFWWFDVRKPFMKFYVSYIIPVIYTILVNCIALKYRRYVKARKIVDQQKIFGGCDESQRLEVGVEFKETVSEDDMCRIWHKIDTSKVLPFIHKYAHFSQFKNREDKRGIWFK